MKSGNSSDVTHKEVIVIGNGPSGIAMSYMLSGNIPYLVSDEHPDELLSARLSLVKNPNLAYQELEHLAIGLEGRSTNPISLLMDALIHPCADIGLEMEPLVEWHKSGVEIDHLVLGKGPPGGSWHTMDPQILTLSLGTWMALPGFPYQARDGVEKRASAGNVARYYLEYVTKLQLAQYFKNNVCVTKIERLNSAQEHVFKCKTPKSEEVDNVFGECCLQLNGLNAQSELCDKRVENKFIKPPDVEESMETELISKPKSCPLSTALNFIRLKSMRKSKTDRCNKRRRDNILKHDSSPEHKIREMIERSISLNDTDIWNLKNGKEIVSSVILEDAVISVDHISPRSNDFGAHHKNRSLSFSCDFDHFKSSCDNIYSKSFNEQGSFIGSLKSSCSLDFSAKVPLLNEKCDKQSDLLMYNRNCDPSSSKSVLNGRKKSLSSEPQWSIETYDFSSGTYKTYTSNYLVLANGASDLPNRLETCDQKKDPAWLLHDLRTLETELDRYTESNNTNYPDPVVIIGAGLSAADAIIATRCRNIPVLHVFRSKATDLHKQLPENMYPEYHKVHQMMQDGGSSYPLYTALPEYSLTNFNESERSVTLTSKTGEEMKYHVSYAVVLIGSRPDLSFLPRQAKFNLGVKKNAPVDCKTNTVHIDKLTYSVNGFDDLYAMGPLAGDNFVRFIPGGALAIVSDLYKKYGY